MLISYKNHLDVAGSQASPPAPPDDPVLGESAAPGSAECSCCKSPHDSVRQLISLLACRHVEMSLQVMEITMLKIYISAVRGKN